MERCLARRAFLFLVVCSFLQTALSDIRSDVCGTITGSLVDAVNSISIPEMFSMNVELVRENNFKDQGNVYSVLMTYDNIQAYLKLSFHQSNMKYLYFYDYLYNQKMYYEIPDSKDTRGTCKRDENLNAAKGFWLVPTAPKSLPADSMGPPPHDILRLSGDDGFGAGGKIQLYYQGETTFRNLKAKKYVSCQFVQDETGGYVAKVTHILTDTPYTEMYAGIMPLQIQFSAKSSVDQSQPVFNYVYNFFHQQSYGFVSDDFETPPGVVCKGRVGPSNFPELPKYISLIQEAHDSNGNILLTERTTYDNELGYVYTEPFDPGANKKNMYRFDDFTSGLSYQIDPNSKACQVYNISAASNNNEAQYTGSKVRLDSPSEFFGTAGVEWHYNGLEIFRGIETESWIGQSPNDPNIVYQWYFMDLYYSVNDYAITQNGKAYAMPYMRKMWFDGTQNYNSVYFFQVDYTVPENFVKLFYCYPNNYHYVVLKVSGIEKDEVTKDINKVVREAQKSLAVALNVPYIRINYPEGYTGFLRFALLGKAPYSPDAQSLPGEPTLDEALATLKSIAGTGKLQLEVGNDDTLIKSEAFYIETKGRDLDLSTTSNIQVQYTSADMAGLAFGMIIVGLVVGGAGGYWFFIKRA